MNKNPEDRIPVIVHVDGLQPRDVYYLGKMNAEDYIKTSRGLNPSMIVVLFECRNIIRYNNESGSITGVAEGGPKPGGWEFRSSAQASESIHKARSIIRMSDLAWSEIQNKPWTG